MSEQELLIGIIGAGARGVLLAFHAHKPRIGVRVAAVADPNPAAFAPLKERLGKHLFCTRDYRQLLEREEIGAVIVSSPDFLHEEHAVAALEAGKAVYLEKPIAISVQGADRILRTAYRKRLKIMVGHNMRYMPLIQKMRDLIVKGAIGEVKAGWCRHFISYGGDAYFKDWHAERRKTTSLLLQKGAHDIDVLHWLCGGYTKRVTAMGNLAVYNQIRDRHPRSEPGNASWSNEHWPPLSQKGMNPVIDVEDLSMMLMELDNGVLCSYQQCHYTPDAWRNYTIIGTEGRIENFGDTPGEAVIRVWNRRSYYNPDGDEQHPIPGTSGGHGGADPEIVRAFLDYVRFDRKVFTSPVAARNSVAAGCMATCSLRHGSVPVNVPRLPGHMVEFFEKDVADSSERIERG